MSRYSIAAFALALTLLACEDATAPLPHSGPPRDLDFSIGGYAGTSGAVRMHGDTVLSWRSPWSAQPGTRIDTMKVVPTAEQWSAFWSAANAIGVNRWRSEYVAEGIADGLGWNLQLIVDDRAITSWGSNAYPDASGRKQEGEFTPEFRAFLDALQALVGQKVF